MATAAAARDAFLARLYEQNQFAIKYDLEAMADAVERLQLHRPATRVVLVGGTNGKGTAAAALASMADALGWRTGLYTSPHLVSFRERIRIDGVALSEDDCVRIGSRLLAQFGGRDAPAPGPRALTFFELTTLLAMVAFQERGPLDLAVIEVGLGGRLDATNALQRDLVLLTGVDFDHQEFLGDTLEEIAREKAGLVRPEVPVLVPTTAPAARILAAACAAAGRAPTTVETSPDASPRALGVALAAEALRCLVRTSSPDTPEPTREAVEQVIARGADRLVWPGRQQRLDGPRGTLWVDGAHNPGSAAACARWLEETRAQRRAPLVAVAGLSGNRTAAEVLAPLVPHVAAWHLARPLSRGRCPHAVAGELRALTGDEATVHGSPAAALRAAEQGSREVLVVGSLYLVGDVLHALGVDADALHPWRRPTDG